MTGDMRRVIVTKRRIYDLEPDAAGVPLQERYPGLALPDRLKDARTYHTPDGPVIATPEAIQKRCAGRPTAHDVRPDLPCK